MHHVRRSLAESDETGYPDSKTIQSLVRQEGRVARNLVSWSVPNQRLPSVRDSDDDDPLNYSTDDGRRPTSSSRSVFVWHALLTCSSRRPPPTSKFVDLKARYWSYLFDNLNRSIDEIYTTCEADENGIECEEVRDVF